MKTANRSAAGDLLNDLAEQVASAAQETLGITEEVASALGTDVAMRMVEQWGGQQLYMPKGIRVEAARLHQQIYEDWKGRNHRDLVRKYGVSLQFIYRVIKIMRRADLNTRQGDMFGPASNN
ncbi:DNA-binding protein [Pseudomonas balearica]|uniref:Mor transcription activator family protein n=1 Tax=Stutzerimonas balearica TaxID=74829 RepID=UPI001F2D7F92|nr:Mor transcription activator family protein [Stutzerimonas balearica]MCF6758290.1 DNA-binding protein [Stutzerimonas balearica]